MNRYKYLLFTTALCLGCIAATLGVVQTHNDVVQKPVVIISGEKSVSVGDYYEFEVGVSNLWWFSKDPVWQWGVFDEHLKEYRFKQDSNKKITLVPTNRSKRYLLVAAGRITNSFWFYSYETNLGVTAKQVYLEGEDPEPEPNPHPKPNPEVPEGKFGIARVAYENFPPDPRLAKAFENNYKGCVAGINAGTITNIDNKENGLFAVVAKNNRQTLSDLHFTEKSVSPWNDAVKSKIVSLHKDKKLVQLNDYKVLFEEIATGLSYVKGKREDD